MRLQQLFLLAIVVLLLHMVEQLLFGLDELYELQAMVGSVLALSPDRDRTIVIMVFALVAVVLFFCYAFMAGGIPRLIAASFVLSRRTDRDRLRRTGRADSGDSMARIQARASDETRRRSAATAHIVTSHYFPSTE
jgi:hypothetical protein